MIRILLDLPELTGIKAELPLAPLVAKTLEVYGRSGTSTTEYPAFLYERLVSVMTQRGAPIEVVRAVASPADAERTVDWNRSPLRARRVADALQAMRSSEDFQALAVLFKRVKNISKELKQDAVLDRGALVEPAERALLEEIDRRRLAIEHAAAASDYRRAFAEIAGLRAPIDRFFTEVFVMAEDSRLRTARLKLMADLRDLILHFADISEIVPTTE